MTINEQASAIYNTIVSGLKGVTSTSSISITQIEDEIIVERMKVIKELIPSRAITASHLMQILPNMPTNACDKARIKFFDSPAKHVEIPRIIKDFHEEAIGYFGPTNRSKPFKVYVDNSYLAHVHNPIVKSKPFVWIDTTPNSNNFYDCYIFNSPLIKNVTVECAITDPREVMLFDDLETFEFTDNTMIANEVIKRMTEKYTRYYRQLASPPTANDQTIKP